MEKDRSQPSTQRVVTEGRCLKKSRNGPTHFKANGTFGQTIGRVTSDESLLGAGSTCFTMRLSILSTRKADKLPETSLSMTLGGSGLKLSLVIIVDLLSWRYSKGRREANRMPPDCRNFQVCPRLSIRITCSGTARCVLPGFGT